MCGINGIVDFSGKVDKITAIRKMNEKINHRGPDNEGWFEDEDIALGHQRLSIIDLSPKSNQPFYSTDKRFVLIYNGEIYNFKEIKNQLLKSYEFETESDSEVLLAAYIKWGTDCLTKFNGMFAFAIWDRKDKFLFIARDRMGVKPLYYYYDDNYFLFSSEIRPLIHSGLIKKEINDDAVYDYLRYQTTHAPETLIKNVFVLMPGTFVTLSDKVLNFNNYWNISKTFFKDLKKRPYKRIVQDIKDLVTSAVERRMVADVPFGAFLSGGIDSSIIVALMSQLSTQKVNTFTVTFDDETFNESRYAKMISERYKTKHTEIKITAKEILENMPQALHAMDYPTADGVNTYIVSKFTKNAGIKMALSGIGGDELFAGYDVFSRINKLSNMNTMYRGLKPLFRLWGNTMYKLKPTIATQKIAEILRKKDISFNNSYAVSRQILLDKDIYKLLKNKEMTGNRVNEIVDKLPKDSDPGYKLPFVSKISIAEIQTYLQNILLRDTDQMSMAVALEVRGPFLDYKLTEFVLGLPDSYKSIGTPKKLLIDALGDLLPEDIYNRKKMGFTFPWNDWLKNELKGFCLSKLYNLSRRGYFIDEEIFDLWQHYLRGSKKLNWVRIWYLVVLENWFEEQGL